MSGSGSGPVNSGSGGGGGGDYISVGGVYVQIPYVDPNVPHAEELRDLSLCVAILQMANFIVSDETRTAIHTAANLALGAESRQFASDVSSAEH